MSAPIQVRGEVVDRIVAMRNARVPWRTIADRVGFSSYAVRCAYARAMDPEMGLRRERALEQRQRERQARLEQDECPKLWAAAFRLVRGAQDMRA